MDHILSELSTMTCLWWPCPTWLIASLSYASPFAMTRLWFMKGNFQMYKLDLEKDLWQRNQRSNCQRSLDHRERKRISEKHLLLLHRLHESLWQCITTNWKIPKEMEISDHLTCLLRNLFAGQEATVRAGHGTKDWFQIGKWAHQGCLLSPWLFNLYADCIMWNAKLDESQAGIKIAGSNTNTSDMQMTPF